MATLSIHYQSPPASHILDYLKSLLNEGITLTHGDAPEATTANILITGRPTEAQLRDNPNLHAVIIPFAGVPTTTQDLFKKFPNITLHNLHHNAPPTAEMALALLMAVAKRIVLGDRDLRKNDWGIRYDNSKPSMLLHGKTALILGYGKIGAHLATILKAMGMKVIATRRRDTSPEQGIYPASQLHDLLPRANVLIVALPGTSHTEGIVGKTELELLPTGAIVVNIGRGSVIDQYALYDALKNGHLFGAGIDVWYHYPKDKSAASNTNPADVPFHDLENIVMSPHHGGDGGDDVDRLRMEALADALNHAARGEPIPNQINIEMGY